MKVTKILLVATLSCMLFVGCKATDIGKEAGVAMEKATYRQVSMEEAMELPDKDQMILVYCRSGNRSKQAAEKLAALGYTNIIEFGGINDWPVEVETSVE